MFGTPEVAPDVAPVVAPNVLAPAPMIRIDSIPVRLAVEVGMASMTIARMFDLQPGAVVVLDRQVDEPLDIRVNGTLIARGEIVAVDGKYGVRVVELADPDGFASGERRS